MFPWLCGVAQERGSRSVADRVAEKAPRDGSGQWFPLEIPRGEAGWGSLFAYLHTSDSQHTAAFGPGVTPAENKALQRTGTFFPRRVLTNYV